MSIKKRFASGLAFLCLVAAGVVGVGDVSPANAASTECRGTTGFYLTRGYAYVPTTANRTGNRNCWLDRSYSYNEAAWYLQYHLKHAEGYSIDIDGYYGDQTAYAVQKLQHHYRLTEDGVYGPNTGRAMLWYGGYWRYGRWQ